MNRLASALSLALLFNLVSCGDDDDKPKTDAATAGTGGTASGGTGGTAGGGGTGGGAGGAGGSTACTGSFMGLTAAQLSGAIAMSTGPKACQADVALLCTGNIASIAGACGVGCASMPAAQVKPCISTCLMNMVSGLSAGCRDCYADTVLCGQMNCLAQCIQNPAAEMCVKCQIEKGCRSAFAMCSGIPMTPAPGGDGGTGDGGGAAGDGGAVDAAATEAGAGTPDGGAVDMAAPTPDTAVSPDTAAATDTAATD